MRLCRNGLQLGHNVGRLMAYFAKAGQRDNTLVVFMSDNGAEGYNLGAYGANLSGTCWRKASV